MQRKRKLTVALLSLIIAITASPGSLQPALAQQNAPCGVVDSVDYPFPDVANRDFFVRFPFGNNRDGFGFHAGEDWFAARGNSLGQAVHAIADGKVTLSAETGWGVDKGIVIVEHALRDGSRIYSMYGHMEELNGFHFPPQETCVRQGDIVGAVGDPRGRPHLHFEIRHKWPTFTGFGYTERPPDLEGWENPTAYITNWQTWLDPAYKWHTVTREPMTAPPAIDDDGTIYIATEGFVQSYGGDSELKYRFPLGDEEVISQLTANEHSVTAYTTEGELRRYLRNLTNTDVSFPGGEFETFIDAGNLLFFHANSGRLRIFSRELRQIGQLLDVGRPVSNAITERMVALATGQRNPEVLIFTPDGELLQRASLRGQADVTPAGDGGVLVRSNRALWHVSPQAAWTFLTDQYDVTPATSTLASDGWGSVYLYAGRTDRQLLSIGFDGQLHWQASLQDVIVSKPVIVTGGGCGVYLASSDGRLTAVNAATGQSGETLQIYPGDSPGRQAWLSVGDNETVYFAVGGSQLIALDGRKLLGLPADTPCINPY